MKTRLARLNPLVGMTPAPLFARPRAQSPARVKLSANRGATEQERRERLALLVRGELSLAPQ